MSAYGRIWESRRRIVERVREKRVDTSSVAAARESIAKMQRIVDHWERVEAELAAHKDDE